MHLVQFVQKYSKIEKGDKVEFYENLKKIREDNELKQEQIAEVLQTTRQYYSEYENGKREIPIRVYIKLAKFYNISIDYLAGLTNKKRPLDDEGTNITILQENNHTAFGVINYNRK